MEFSEKEMQEMLNFALNEFESQEDVLAFLGRETVVKFSHICDNVARFNCVTPIKVGTYYMAFGLDVFLPDVISEMFCYEKVGDLLHKKVGKKLFEFYIGHSIEEMDCLYSKKIDEL